MSMIKKQIDKLKNLKLVYEQEEYDTQNKESLRKCTIGVLQDAIDTIQALSEKLSESNLNNGWIKCSERLPDEPFGCLVTVIDCNPMTMEDFENILPYFVGYDGAGWNDCGGERIPFEVIAWQPLPKSYEGQVE